MQLKLNYDKVSSDVLRYDTNKLPTRHLKVNDVNGITVPT